MKTAIRSFTEKDVAALSKKSALALQRVFNVAPKVKRTHTRGSGAVDKKLKQGNQEVLLSACPALRNDGIRAPAQDIEQGS